MKKIPTLFPKDPKNLKLVLNEKPIIEITNDLEFYKKLDGRACAIINGKLYTRYDAKLIRRKRGKVIKFSKEEIQKKIPKNAIPCQEPDEKSGHWPHWIPCNPKNKDHKYIFEAFENSLKIFEDMPNGTYECIGPKVNANPHGLKNHFLIKHDSKLLKENFIDFESLKKDPYNYLKNFLTPFLFEGLVVWKNGEPIAKIRRGDFGLDVFSPIKYTNMFLDDFLKL